MDDIYDVLDDPNCMSESDWRNAGLDYGAGFTETQRHEIESVIDLLCGPLRSELLAQARKLIIKSRDIYKQRLIVEPIWMEHFSALACVSGRSARKWTVKG